ncbi:helix-turn-helix domain-containing protein [Planobispora longispora]|uniref:helix-turn-helix domain-containing protein n=1 Tax=Planobispora longispora TaxID=28887 RepID=UPI00360998B6
MGGNGSAATGGNELGAFLRSRREAVVPPPWGSRRLAPPHPGLRRAELATLAGVSVEYLTRLEQGRDRRPSGEILAALADALGLSPTSGSTSTASSRRRRAAPARTSRRPHGAAHGSGAAGPARTGSGAGGEPAGRAARLHGGVRPLAGPLGLLEAALPASPTSPGSSSPTPGRARPSPTGTASPTSGPPISGPRRPSATSTRRFSPRS